MAAVYHHLNHWFLVWLLSICQTPDHEFILEKLNLQEETWVLKHTNNMTSYLTSKQEETFNNITSDSTSKQDETWFSKYSNNITLNSTSMFKSMFLKCEFLNSAVSNPNNCSKHFTFYSLADLFNRTWSWLLWEASSHTAINTWRLFIYKHPPLFISRYSFILLSELEQCRVTKLAQGLTWQRMIRTRVLLVLMVQITTTRICYINSSSSTM